MFSFLDLPRRMGGRLSSSSLLACVPQSAKHCCCISSIFLILTLITIVVDSRYFLLLLQFSYKFGSCGFFSSSDRQTLSCADNLSNSTGTTHSPFSRESRVSLEELLVRSESSSKCFCFFLTFQWRHSARDANQSEIWSWAQIEGTG